jgi:hypothetical protein
VKVEGEGEKEEGEMGEKIIIIIIKRLKCAIAKE